MELVGIPEAVVSQMRSAPFRPALEAIAQSLVYEAVLMGDGSLHDELVEGVSTPTLAIAGTASFPFMRETADRLAQLMPNCRALALEGQTHDIEPSVLGPELETFFLEGS
jgi:pimeloyl-ACP methyl ester carboxylesterase